MSKVNIKKLDFSSYQTTVGESIKALIAAGFTGTIDSETCEGELKYLGCDVKFSIGSENIYFSPSAVMFKSAPVEAAEALKSFIDESLNF